MISKRLITAAAFLTAVGAGAIAAPPGTVSVATASPNVASAEEEAPEGDAEPAATEAKEEKKVCRTERITGSLTRRSRVCLTKTQWQEVHDRTRRGLDELVGSASGSPKCLNQGQDC